MNRTGCWDDKLEERYFAAVDVVAVFTDGVIRNWPKGGDKLSPSLFMQTAISEKTESQTMNQHMDVARRRGNVAHTARIQLEKELGRSVISSQNAKEIGTPPPQDYYPGEVTSSQKKH